MVTTIVRGNEDSCMTQETKQEMSIRGEDTHFYPVEGQDETF